MLKFLLCHLLDFLTSLNIQPCFKSLVPPYFSKFYFFHDTEINPPHPSSPSLYSPIICPHVITVAKPFILPLQT